MQGSEWPRDAGRPTVNCGGVLGTSEAMTLIGPLWLARRRD